jgi:hypothetical protein
MPPQQPNRLLDLVDDLLDFSAHGLSVRLHRWDLGLQRTGRNSQSRPSSATMVEAWAAK